MTSFSSTSIQFLVERARLALNALVPIAEELKIPWREPDNYHSWDIVAAGLFEGFVLEVVRSSDGWADRLPLLNYDKRINNYGEISYIGCRANQIVRPLVCFETETLPFDRCLLAELDASLMRISYTSVPFDECKFVAVSRSAYGDSAVLESIAFG